MSALAALIAFGAAAACSLTVDLDPLQDGICAPGSKPCNGECVTLRNPTTGCASPSCAPCSLPKATAICAPTGECTIAACIGAYRDCDGRPATGCEVDIDHDPDNCGDCGAPPCFSENGTAGCTAGRCATGACDPGFGDCNREVDDGCEAELLSDASNCGTCGRACAEGLACIMGECGSR